MQEVFDFLAGKLSIEKFESSWKSSPEIADWLQQLVDDNKDSYESMNDDPYSTYRNAILYFHEGSVRSFTKDIYEDSYGFMYYVHRSALFTTVYSIVKVVFPDVPVTTMYNEQRDLCDYALGDSIGGPEVDKVIGDIIAEVFELPKKGRKKLAKEKIREAFPCEKRYPFWAQEPEWPMGEKRPMKFLNRKRDGDRVDFLFEDIDTGKLRVVTQYY